MNKKISITLTVQEVPGSPSDPVEITVKAPEKPKDLEPAGQLLCQAAAFNADGSCIDLTVFQDLAGVVLRVTDENNGGRVTAAADSGHHTHLGFNHVDDLLTFCAAIRDIERKLVEQFYDFPGSGNVMPHHV